MTKAIAIIGASGNMGTKYRVIMDYLKIPYKSFDEHNWLEINEQGDELHSVLICSPTNCHFKNIMGLKYSGLPVLVEKPVSKLPGEINKLLSMGFDLKMINQYRHFAGKGKGESFYSFYKTGDDGLEFDCISIIALSNNPPILNNTSPVWRCSINGTELNREQIDKGYIREIEDWYKKPVGDLAYIEMAHKKVFNGYYVR